MAINVYTGLMGSGKTYEVVSSVVVPAIKAGRRVVTNIHGLNEQEIHKYLGGVEGLGKVLHVEDSDVTKQGFFPDEKKPDVESIVQPGDLVVIDEAWRFWDKGQKLSEEHMQFFRLHRHYTHPDTGVSCDLSLIFQSITDVHRSLRSVVESSFRTVKLKSLGLSKFYRIEVYEGDRLTSVARITEQRKKYDPRIFKLYQSYAGGVGKELVMDDRQNLFKSKKFIFLGVSCVVAIAYSVFNVISFLEPSPIIEEDKSVETEPVSLSSSGRDSRGVVGRRFNADWSNDYRVSGFISSRGHQKIVVVDTVGRWFYAPADIIFNGSGRMMKGEIDGKKIGPFTGDGGVFVEKSSGILGK